MELGSVDAAVAALRAANEAVAALAVERLNAAETTTVLDEIQTLRCQLPSHDDALLAHLQTETTPKELGAKNWNQVLATRWRISTSEAGRRLHDAALFGPRAMPYQGNRWTRCCLRPRWAGRSESSTPST